MGTIKNYPQIQNFKAKYRKQARLSWATLEFQVKVRSKYGCANVRLLGKIYKHFVKEVFGSEIRKKEK